MNVFKSIALSLGALSILPAVAQQDSAPTTVNLLLQTKNGRPTEAKLIRASGKNAFEYMVGSNTMQVNLNGCRLFMIQTPADIVAAMTSYRRGNLENARTRLGAAKKKYAAMAGLPNSPADTAAYYELLCSIRLMDWASVKSLCASFPAGAFKAPYLKLDVEAAKFLGELADLTPEKAVELEKSINAWLEKKENVTGVELEFYGFLRYAQATAIMAQIPAVTIATGQLEGDVAKRAITAADYFCEAYVAQHGANRSIAVEALLNAGKLLWGLKNVQAYVEEVGVLSDMNQEKWTKAPADFREAVVLIRLARALSEKPLNDPALTKIDKHYFNNKQKAAAE